nr:DUF72 domain-containing protein [Sphingomonas aliaeris]
MAPVIGTARWAIAAAERPRFPNEGSSLQRYASVLNGVEVNSSFHGPHRRTTWERWAKDVPESFRFAAKIPKEISHVRRLVDVDAPLDRFLEEAGGLGDKLAILLLQLPPSLEFDGDVAGAFLRSASSKTKASIVVEPRHGSWFSPQADDLLAGLGIARVAADPARIPAGGATRRLAWPQLLPPAWFAGDVSVGLRRRAPAPIRRADHQRGVGWNASLVHVRQYRVVGSAR